MSSKASQRYNRSLWLLERLGLRRLRHALLGDVTGKVLEVGIGTGINLPHYAGGRHITGLDASLELLAGTRERISSQPFAVTCADTQDLPFQGEEFDTVVGSLVFCCIANPTRALAEIGRVLRPSGQLLLLEHVRGQGPISRRVTDWLHPVWFALQGTCHLNRDTAETVRSAGFEVMQIDRHGWGVLQLIRAHPSRKGETNLPMRMQARDRSQ